MAACGSPRVEPAPAPSPAAPPAVAEADAAIDAMTAMPAIAYPPALARPTGCILSGDWDDQPRELAFVPGGKPYATMSHIEEAHATFGDSVFADLRGHWVQLGGYVDVSQVRVYAAKPMVIAGWIIPYPDVALAYRGATTERVRFAVKPPAGVRAKANVVGDEPCASMAIDQTSDFDARAAIDGKTIDDGQFRENRVVPLSLEPGKPPVAQLEYKTNTPPVEILEKKGKQVRVVVGVASLDPQEHMLLVGWVSASAVHKVATGFGGSWGDGNGRGVVGSRPERRARYVTCDGPTPLIAELAGERRVVGTIAPKAVLRLPPADADFMDVFIERPDAVPAEGARWLVAREAIAGCRATQRP
jgi:hypothetical protein